MFGRRRNRAAEPDDRWAEQLSTIERFALVAMFRDELARGWLPQRTDLEAALSAYRHRRLQAGRTPLAG